MSFPTPIIPREIDFEQVYEPAEDTFLMLDGLERDVEFMRELRPSLCMEIGSGSGCNITFLGTILRPHIPVLLAVDINPYANRASKKLGQANGVELEAVRTSLTEGLRLHKRVDVLIFNPPYVPSEGGLPTLTEIENCTERRLEAAWAGGPDGRHWIDLLLTLVPSLLSDNGVFYMVVVDENKPAEIAEWAKELGLTCSSLIDRRARNEHLSILKFTRIKF